jgi:hypothetical protein
MADSLSVACNSSRREPDRHRIRHALPPILNLEDFHLLNSNYGTNHVLGTE